MIDAVFVYGLLMRQGELHHRMLGADFLGAATTTGTLISLGGYPGLIEGQGEVRGELYRFSDVAAGLEILDAVENYDPADPQGSLYLRCLRPVRRDDGTTVEAWLYTYNQTPEGAPVIDGGDWRRFVRATTSEDAADEE